MKGEGGTVPSAGGGRGATRELYLGLWCGEGGEGDIMGKGQTRVGKNNKHSVSHTKISSSIFGKRFG